MASETRTQYEARIERARALYQKQRSKDGVNLLAVCEKALDSNRVDAAFISEMLALKLFIYTEDEDGAAVGSEMAIADIMKEHLPDYIERADAAERERKELASRKRKEAAERKILKAARSLAASTEFRPNRRPIRHDTPRQTERA